MIERTASKAETINCINMKIIIIVVKIGKNGP